MKAARICIFLLLPGGWGAAWAQQSPPPPPPPTLEYKVAASEIIFVGTVSRVQYRIGNERLIDDPGDRAGWRALGEVVIEQVLSDRGKVKAPRAYVSIGSRGMSTAEVKEQFIGKRFVFFGALRDFRGATDDGSPYLDNAEWWRRPESMSRLRDVKEAIENVARNGKPAN